MIAGPLLLFAALVTFAAPGLLGRARWAYRSPRLGIAAWHAVLAAVLSAVVAATVSMLLPERYGEAPVGVAWEWCLHIFRGDDGTAVTNPAIAVVIITVLLGVRLVVCAVRFARRQAGRRREHQRWVTLTGTQLPEWGATVVQCPQPAAYMLAGCERRIVVTTGAVAALTAEELAAVLAHERAHATGRHDVILDGVRLLRAAFPRLPLFSAAEQQLGRLVEMRADDVAVAQHPGISLARALVVMAGAAVMPAGTGAVAATGGDAVARLGRLLTPPDRMTGAHQSLIGVGIVVTATFPAGALVASWIFPLLNACLPPAT